MAPSAPAVFQQSAVVRCQQQPQHLTSSTERPQRQASVGSTALTEVSYQEVRIEAPRTLFADACSITERACGRTQRSAMGKC